MGHGSQYAIQLEGKDTKHLRWLAGKNSKYAPAQKGIKMSGFFFLENGMAYECFILSRTVKTLCASFPGSQGGAVFSSVLLLNPSRLSLVHLGPGQWEDWREGISLTWWICIMYILPFGKEERATWDWDTRGWTGLADPGESICLTLLCHLLPESSLSMALWSQLLQWWRMQNDEQGMAHRASSLPGGMNQGTGVSA